MTANQKNIIAAFVLMNIIVYGALYRASIFSPEPERTDASLIALALPNTPVFTLTLSPTNTRTLSVTPSPTRTSTPTFTPTPTNSPTALAQATPSLTSTSPPTPTISKTAGLDSSVVTPFTPTRDQKPAASIVLPAATTIVPKVALAGPSGASPANPLIPNDSRQTLGSGASAWYKIGSGGVHMDVFLEANPLSGMTLEVFAPDNTGRPIGQGTLESATNRLVWAGGHWNSSGDWLARVTNGNPMSVQFKLTSQTRDIGTCDSISYWEYIGKNLVYWTRCR